MGKKAQLRIQVLKNLKRFLVPEFSKKSNRPNTRIIGIFRDNEAQAYSVPKLSYHEIANSIIGNKPIAAGY